MMGPQAALSPTLGAPATPVPWQAMQVDSYNFFPASALATIAAPPVAAAADAPPAAGPDADAAAVAEAVGAALDIDAALACDAACALDATATWPTGAIRSFTAAVDSEAEPAGGTVSSEMKCTISNRMMIGVAKPISRMRMVLRSVGAKGRSPLSLEGLG